MREGNFIVSRQPQIRLPDRPQLNRQRQSTQLLVMSTIGRYQLKAYFDGRASLSFHRLKKQLSAALCRRWRLILAQGDLDLLLATISHYRDFHRCSRRGARYLISQSISVRHRYPVKR
jgi:hypothetical protein